MKHQFIILFVDNGSAVCKFIFTCNGVFCSRCAFSCGGYICAKHMIASLQNFNPMTSSSSRPYRKVNVICPKTFTNENILNKNCTRLFCVKNGCRIKYDYLYKLIISHDGNYKQSHQLKFYCYLPIR